MIMLPGGADPLYQAMLATAHEPYVRVEVWAAGVRQEIPEEFRSDTGGLIILAGSAMQATLDSQVSRNLTLQLPIGLYPETDDALLAPMGNEIRVWAGVRGGDGSLTYVWQIFRGKIQDPAEDEQTGNLFVPCADLAQDVLDHQFVNPENAVNGTSINAEYRRLVRDVHPDATFGPGDDFPQPVPARTWEFDRGSALEEMHTSVGALWYPLGDGSFVQRLYPWTVPGDPVIVLSDGPGGVILSTSRRKSRTNIYNSITVTGERLNGDDPVMATKQDDNPTSATYVGGKFGVRSLLRRKQTPSTPAGAQYAAAATLRSTISPTEQWSWTQATDAARELGDIIALNARGRTGVIQVVQSFTIPLGGGRMTTQGRAQVIGEVQAGL